MSVRHFWGTMKAPTVVTASLVSMLSILEIACASRHRVYPLPDKGEHVIAFLGVVDQVQTESDDPRHSAYCSITTSVFEVLFGDSVSSVSLGAGSCIEEWPSCYTIGPGPPLWFAKGDQVLVIATPHDLRKPGGLHDIHYARFFLAPLPRQDQPTYILESADLARVREVCSTTRAASPDGLYELVERTWAKDNLSLRELRNDVADFYNRRRHWRLTKPQ